MFRDEYAVAPVAQRFHPELGYLCPAAGLRRRVRQVAKLVLVAVAVAGGAAFGLSSALLAPTAGEAARVAPGVERVPTGQKAGAPAAGTAAAGAAAQAITAAAVPTTVETKAGEPKMFESKTFASETVAPAAAPSTQRTATVSGEAALAHAQAACDDLSLSFLSPQCRPGRKSHSAHSPTTSRLATVPLGRVDAPPAAEPHKAAELRKPASPPARTEAGAEPAPADKPAKKPAKTAQEHVPIRGNAGADSAAAAPASPTAFGLFALFRNLPRLANSPFGQSLP